MEEKKEKNKIFIDRKHERIEQKRNALEAKMISEKNIPHYQLRKDNYCGWTNVQWTRGEYMSNDRYIAVTMPVKISLFRYNRLYVFH